MTYQVPTATPGMVNPQWNSPASSQIGRMSRPSSSPSDNTQGTPVQGNASGYGTNGDSPSGGYVPFLPTPTTKRKPEYSTKGQCAAIVSAELQKGDGCGVDLMRSGQQGHTARPRGLEWAPYNTPSTAVIIYEWVWNKHLQKRGSHGGQD